MSIVLKATIENKTTSVATHFKKLSTGNNVFITGSIARSANLPVFSLLRGQF